jgi:hypothetical protein
MDDILKNVDWELKKKKVKEKTQEAARKFGDWFNRNEETIRTWAPIVIPGIGLAFRQAIREHNNKSEIRAKELYHWDPRRGEYYMSRRPLTSSEQLELDRLYSLGYTKGEALKKMKLLK